MYRPWAARRCASSFMWPLYTPIYTFPCHVGHYTEWKVGLSQARGLPNTASDESLGPKSLVLIISVSIFWMPFCHMKSMKRCSTLLMITEMQIKTRMRYHLTPARTAIIKMSMQNKWWTGYGKRECSYIVGGNVNWYSHHGEQYGGSLKNYKQSYHST